MPFFSSFTGSFAAGRRTVAGGGGGGDPVPGSLSMDLDLADFGTATFTNALTQETTFYGLAFSPDGTVMYTSRSAFSFHYYNLSPGWDLSDPNSDHVGEVLISVGNGGGAGGDIFYDPTGTRFWSTEFGADEVVKEFSMGTAHDASTLNGSPVATFDVETIITPSNAANYLRNMRWGDNGNKLYVCEQGFGGAGMHELNASTAYDITTLTASGNKLNVTQVTWGGGFTSVGMSCIVWCNNGQTLLVQESTSTGTRYLVKYTLSTAWDLSTASYDSRVAFSTLGMTGQSIINVWPKPDGTTFYYMMNDETIAIVSTGI